ncbi:monooxygenase 2-like [Magnolia sinica]|uniref:monooxygenase 2-like n=1 Tax=Magnolia sinica TaxID=86752 RepID=UPI002658AFEB|nr:monooxygenase 2-like [Magnolia sinica]
MIPSPPLYICPSPLITQTHSHQSLEMEVVEDTVIVGAGIAGLAASLGLYRMGLRSVVLESSDSLRATGFAFTAWTNAWKALDALGIGDSLRQQHVQLHGLVVASVATGLATSQVSFIAKGKLGDHEVRCVRRNMLLEALERELPRGTIRFGSKVVSIEETWNLKLVHLADGSILKAKVLVGCDGVNSVVAKWLGLPKPPFPRRSAARGIAEYPGGHGFKSEFLQYVGDGFRSGFLPCDEKTIYWFFTFISSPQAKDAEENPAKMKHYLLSLLQKAPKEVTGIIEKTELDTILSSPLRFRFPWDVLWGRICKNNVCVAGDAFHPMTPDLGQGACSALEDGVTLARCIGEALLGKSTAGGDESGRISRGLEKYAKERRCRGFDLIPTGYVLGFIQQSNGVVMSFLRDKCLAGFMAGMYLNKADFDCGTLFRD